MINKDYATAPFNFIPLPTQVIERYAAEGDIPGHERYRREQEGFYSGRFHMKFWSILRILRLL